MGRMVQRLGPNRRIQESTVELPPLWHRARIAKTMIEVIKSGGSLPADLVEQLSIVKL